MTGGNPNVFYELAVRHAYDKPFIQIIDSSEEPPFDVYDSRTIHVDVNDVESVREAESRIQSQIEEIESDDFDANNPISVATELRSLRESGDPESESLADIKEYVSEIRNTMISIQNNINEPENILPPEHIEKLVDDYRRGNIEDLISHMKRIRFIALDIKSNIEQDEVDKASLIGGVNDLLEATEHAINQLEKERENIDFGKSAVEKSIEKSVEQQKD